MRHHNLDHLIYDGMAVSKDGRTVGSVRPTGEYRYRVLVGVHAGKQAKLVRRESNKVGVYLTVDGHELCLADQSEISDETPED